MYWVRKEMFTPGQLTGSLDLTAESEVQPNPKWGQSQLFPSGGFQHNTHHLSSSTLPPSKHSDSVSEVGAHSTHAAWTSSRTHRPAQTGDLGTSQEGKLCSQEWGLATALPLWKLTSKTGQVGSDALSSEFMWDFVREGASVSKVLPRVKSN